ncbi:signal peptidase I [Sorangium sp. So ce385]|uniref:signal peptidase I n=1 Tax=Sorangium sp. So ce385 TaxID=3133308 RepID=UPI003F5C6C7E
MRTFDAEERWSREASPTPIEAPCARRLCGSSMLASVLAAVHLLAGCAGSAPGSSAALGPAPTTPAEPHPVEDRRTFAERAPARTRLLAQIDPKALPAGNIGAVVGWDAERCGVDVEKSISRVQIAVAEPAEIRADILGSLTIEDVGCLLEAEPDGGRLRAGPLEIVALPRGGVRVATPRALADGPGANVALARRLDQALSRSGAAAVADLGPADAAIELVATVTDHLEARLSSPGRSDASLAGARLAEALATARQDGAAGLEPLEIVAAPPDGLVMRVKIATDAALAVATPLAVRRHVIESFKVPSGSMSPTVMPGDHLFVLKDRPGERAGRGDVIVFRSPADPRQRFIKRIIATGGDRVQIDAGGLRINGRQVPSELVGAEHVIPGDGGHPYELWQETLGERRYPVLRPPGGPAPSAPGPAPSAPGPAPSASGPAPSASGPAPSASIDAKVPRGSVYVLGDNRDNSYDSRHFGPVPVEAIEGIAAVIYFSIDTNGLSRWDRIGLPVR